MVEQCGELRYTDPSGDATARVAHITTDNS
jgi:hypothetical protein